MIAVDSDHMVKERNILLCVSGSSPAIITETLWCLTQGYNAENKNFKIDEVHVITTTSGKETLENSLFKSGKFEEFRKDYPDCSNIKFSERFIHVLTTDKNKKPEPSDSEDIQLRDVKTGEENECAANQIYLILKDFVEKSTRIHASAAGGRKTMSIYLTVMMQLLARAEDTLSHIVVWDEFESDREFLYPKPELLKSDKPLPISLAFIPFIRLKEVGKSLIDDLTIGNSYSEAVKAVRENLKLAEADEKLVLNLRDLTVLVGENKTRISGTRMLLLLLYESIGKGSSISDNDLAFETFDNAFYRLNGKRFRFAEVTGETIAENLITGEILDAYNSLEGIFTVLKKTSREAQEEYLKKMREWRSRINNDVMKKKLNLSKKYLIQNKGEYGDAKFGFDIDVEVIE